MKVFEVTKIPKVLGAGLATDDGFVIDSQFTVGYDAQKSAAMAAQVVKRVKTSLLVEKASVILYTHYNVFFIKEINEGIFFAICQKDANLGLVKIKTDKIE
jgi:predicted regulator of Ras-like GTPase activity (Roadblock/LC7/MglB family)